MTKVTMISIPTLVKVIINTTMMMMMMMINDTHTTTVALSIITTSTTRTSIPHAIRSSTMTMTTTTRHIRRNHDVLLLIESTSTASPTLFLSKSTSNQTKNYHTRSKLKLKFSSIMTQIKNKLMNVLDIQSKKYYDDVYFNKAVNIILILVMAIMISLMKVVLMKSKTRDILRGIVFISSFLFARKEISKNRNNGIDDSIIMDALLLVKQKFKSIRQRSTPKYWIPRQKQTTNTKPNTTQKTIINHDNQIDNNDNDPVDEMIQSITLKIQQMNNDPSLSSKERKMKRTTSSSSSSFSSSNQLSITKKNINSKQNSQAWVQQSLSNVNETNRVMSQMKQDELDQKKVQRKKLDEQWVQKTLNDTYDALKNAELQKRREEQGRIKAQKWAESVAKQSGIDVNVD